jgi:ABC-type uncharacterized transport system fused permease/ATPase subunit
MQCNNDQSGCMMRMWTCLQGRTHVMRSSAWAAIAIATLAVRDEDATLGASVASMESPGWRTEEASTTGRWYIWPSTLAATSLRGELCSVATMYQLGGFYETISANDLRGFLRCLEIAVVVVSASAIFKSLSQYATNMCAITWRYRLVSVLHRTYFRNAGSVLNGGSDLCSPIDNVDQRIAADSKFFTEKLALLISKLIVVPAVVIYYTVYLAYSFGVFVPLCCFAFCIVGCLCTQWLISKLSGATRKVDVLEGDFRFLHSLYRIHTEDVLMTRGQLSEEIRAGSLLRRLFSLENCRVKWKLALDLVTNMFQYSGATSKQIQLYLSIDIDN